MKNREERRKKTSYLILTGRRGWGVVQRSRRRMTIRAAGEK
jgi:hypothetical protein